MFQYTNKRCSKCLLQEDKSRNFIINEHGLCNFCANWDPEEKDWDALAADFEKKIEAIKAQNKVYDAVLMMSGGKDSAFLAWILKEKYKLNMLALTIDNNFEYEETFIRAAEIVKELGLPQIQFRMPPLMMKRFYRFIMSERQLKEKDFGQLCLYCGKMLLDQGIYFACRLGIPSVIAGYNPDQLFGMGKSLPIEKNLVRRRQQEAILRKLQFQFKKAHTLAAASRNEELLPIFTLGEEPCELLYPFLYLPYKPLEMMEVVQREVRWKPIESFSRGNYIASGCKLLKLMAALAQINDVSSYMDVEFSSQVRQGSLTKEALKAYYESILEDRTFYEDLIKELGINENLETLANVCLTSSKE